MAKSKAPLVRKAGWYGWHPDLPDHRDHLFSLVHGKPKAALPKKIDLRPKCPPVVNQGNLGSCTANALAGALGFLEVKGGKPFAPFSRLFIYYNERVIENDVGQDNGAQLRDGIKSLAKQGACSEKSWPYQIKKFTVKPAPPCYKEASNRQITSYQRLNTVDDMRACLASGFPFVFGFTVYDAFESDAVAKSGVLNLPKKSEQVLGGHAVLAVGYDDGSKRFIVRNSWGTDWGQAGYFTMPYDYLGNRDLSDDLWTVRAAEGV
jgi:C1A family cysteine protease